MSAQATNEWKVGAFIVGGVVFMILTLFWLGASRLNTEVIEHLTYLDESVQGLEVGAPIKIRGVTIGRVTEISLAPDRRLVEVRFEASVEELHKVRAIGETESAGHVISPELRILIASQGITGVKFLEADFFTADTPTIPLSFDAPDSYVPSMPSTLKSLESALRGVGDELPGALRDFRKLAVTLDEQVVAMDMAALTASLTGLSNDLRGVLDGSGTTGIAPEVSGLIGDFRALAAGVNDALASMTGDGGTFQTVAASVTGLSDDVRATLGKVDGVMEGVDVAGTLTSFRGATDSFTRLSDGLSPAAQSMPAAVRDLRAMLRRIEALAALIERDPGVFLRGR